MQRRHLLVALIAGFATSGRGFAADSIERIPLAKAFRYLDSYLGLAPTLRSRFHLVFLALRNEHPAPDLKAAVVRPGGQSTPLPVDARGQVVQLPTLGELKSDAVLEVRDGANFRFATEIRPNLPPSTRIDVAQLDLALSQANEAIAQLAGPFSVAAPKLDVVLFPDAGSGQVVLANGRVATLGTTDLDKLLGAVLYYQPDALPGARVVSLARPPSRIIFAHRPT